MQNLSIKPREVLGFTLSVIAITTTVVLWVMFTFQSKADAAKQDLRIDNIETKFDRVASDVSYIRGYIESKQRKEF